jgi:hypothetical protein
MRPFKRTLVTRPDLNGLRAVVPDIEVMMVTILDCILDRCDRRSGYPFIDTKLSILTGEDFGDADDPSRDFKGPTAIYAWIQGRGLESLVGHARWLGRCSVLSASEKESRVARLGRMIGQVFDRMESIRAANGGRLFFTMTPDGKPFDLDEGGRRRVIAIGAGRNFSDLFYAKGMLAAAHYLGRPRKVDEAKDVFRAVLDDVLAERFVSDQISFNPKNAPAGRSPMAGEGPTPGRFFLGVQWHPEDLLDEPPHRALFEALVRAAQPAG